MSGLRRSASRLVRNNEWTWRYLLNRRSSLAYRRNRPVLGPEEKKIAALLARDGFALSSVPELLGSSALFEELRQAVRREEERRSAEVQRTQVDANQRDTIGQKTFLLELLGRVPAFDPASVFARFAMQRSFLRIAGAYFGMYTVLRTYNVWHNFPMQGEARESQLWHRDREDFQILKVFVYLEDVVEGSGPLSYVPGSHRLGPRRGSAESFAQGNVQRSTDEQMERFAPRGEWVQAVGPAGTVVFADTRGYHKGGLARDHERLLFMMMFTSPRSASEKLFQPAAALPEPADGEEAFALLDARGVRSGR